MLLTIGWVIATLLYIALHHFYNWLARIIGTDNDNFILHFPAFIIYGGLNYAYFLFTYNVFKFL